MKNHRLKNAFGFELQLLKDLSGSHVFIMYTKFSEKLRFLAPWYAHVREGKKC